MLRITLRRMTHASESPRRFLFSRSASTSPTLLFRSASTSPPLFSRSASSLTSSPPPDSIWSALDDDLTLIKFLRKDERHKEQIEAVDSSGMTPLHHTSLSGQIGLMRTLLAAGASVSRLDPYGRSALTFAAVGNKRHALALLLHMGAEPLQQDKDLYYAFDYSSDPAIDALLNHTGKGFSSAELGSYAPCGVDRAEAEADGTGTLAAAVAAATVSTQATWGGPEAGDGRSSGLWEEDPLADSVDPLAPLLSVNAGRNSSTTARKSNISNVSNNVSNNDGVGESLLVPNIVVASLVGADGCTAVLASLGWEQEQEQEPGAGAEAGAVAGPELAGAGTGGTTSSSSGGGGVWRKKGGVDTVLGQWD